VVETMLRIRQNGRSQRAFAAELGVSQTLISRLLRGEYRLGSRAARRIAGAHPDLGRVLAAAVADAVLETPADRPKEVS
jgi:transcriptional regulator with XRE-family HTH domain